MSIIKSIKQQLGLGGTASEQHFWDGSVANQLTLKRGTPDAPGAELIKALNGLLSFPNQGQSLTGNGYIKLPGGLIVQWGGVNTDAAGDATVTLPVAFPTGIGVVLAVPALASRNQVFNAYSHSKTLLNFQIYSFQTINGAATSMAVDWIAIGY